jgi:hypothetical protein
MEPIISVICDNKKIHFYPNGTFSGIAEKCAVLNAYPLIVRRIQAALIDGMQKGETLSHFVDWFNCTMGVSVSIGASQETAKCSDNILSQAGDDPGGK